MSYNFKKKKKKNLEEIPQNIQLMNCVVCLGLF